MSCSWRENSTGAALTPGLFSFHHYPLPWAAPQENRLGGAPFPDGWHAQGGLLTSGAACHCPGPATLGPAESSDPHSLQVTVAPAPGQHSHSSPSPALAVFLHSESFRAAAEGQWPGQPHLKSAVTPPTPPAQPSPASGTHIVPGSHVQTLAYVFSFHLECPSP